MMSHYCSECVINWNPYQTRDGACPGCGGGTVRQQEPASDEADEMYQVLVAEERRQHTYKMFEEFYAEREAAKLEKESKILNELGSM